MTRLDAFNLYNWLHSKLAMSDGSDKEFKAYHFCCEHHSLIGNEDTPDDHPVFAELDKIWSDDAEQEDQED